MSVYVDPSFYKFGRMTMCHMIADTREELYAMADKIGIARKWIQHHGSYREHFDICKSKRKLAVEAGAIELSVREMGMKLREKRSVARPCTCGAKHCGRKCLCGAAEKEATP